MTAFRVGDPRSRLVFALVIIVMVGLVLAALMVPNLLPSIAPVGGTRPS
jgi:hypothetical protein